MKNSENLRLIVKGRRIYRRTCNALVRFAIAKTTAAADKRITKQDVETANTPMTISVLDRVVFWSGVAGVVFTALAAVSGAIAFIVSIPASKQKEDADGKYRRRSEEAVATANQRVAEAELKTEELRQKTLIPRHLDFDKSGAVLKAGAKRKAVITFAPTAEASVFANMIFSLLESAGWQVAPPMQMPATAIPGKGIQILGSGGVKPGGKLAEPVNTVWESLQASPDAGPISWGILTEPNADPILIVVGTKL